MESLSKAIELLLIESQHPVGLIEMTTEQYHTGPGISKSHLDVIAGKSPLHYWHRYINPDREPDEPTPAMLLGSAMHIAILEPDLLNKQVIESPNFDRKTKAGREMYNAFVEENRGKIVLSPDDMSTVKAIRDRAHLHPKIGQLLKYGKAEQKVFARDAETGELIKCCVDWMPEGGGLTLDLKSTEDASEAAFLKSVFNFRYDVQAAWYENVLDQAFGDHPEHWGFLAFEKKPPYAMGIYMLDPWLIKEAYATARRDFERIIHHRKNGYWPDYAMEPRMIDQRPPWFKRG